MDLIQIGKFTKTFGTEGYLRCKIENQYLDDFLATKVLFARLAGQAVPFFIENLEEEPELHVQVDELTNRESALQLAGKAIFLRPEDCQNPEAVAKDALIQQFDRWEGFLIIDQDLGEIAVIEAFVELPQQVLAVVNYQGKEIMIPFAPEIILDINENEKSLLMDLPGGILDL
jgi:16S rRNA processing protein RimM